MPKNDKPQPPTEISGSPETTYSCAITVQKSWTKGIEQTVPGDYPFQAKVEALAGQFLTDMCLGAIMMQPHEVKKLQEVLGKEVFPADIMEQFQRGVGRKEGKLQITISLDPAYEGVARQAAEFQGVGIKELLQKAWDTAWDNGDFYDPRVSTERILMTHEDKKELVAVLGKDFANGTELAAMVKQYAAEHEGLFDEVTK